MLAAIPSRHKPVNTSLDILKSKTITTDSVTCISPVTQLDTIDNPVLRQFLEPDVTEENIFTQMKSECNRLYSFQNKWPLHDISPKSLAESGLFYLQQEDKVQCPFCFVIIFNWARGDKPLREHMRKSPKCPFLTGCDVGNIPLASEKNRHIVSPVSERKCSSHSVSVSYKPKHPRMADVRRRLLTYSGWPLNNPEPQQLSECGLYYSGVADVVTCFFCGGTLGNWEPADDPWNEHSKFFPECTFLALAKSKKKHPSKVMRPAGKQLSNPKKDSAYGLPSADAMSEVVEQALDIFPENLVLEAVKRKNGSIFSLQELCDDILELKRKPHEWSNSVSSQEEAASTKSQGSASSNIDLLLCKVCMDRERGVVFQPCGHFVSCWNCSNFISDCPVCRRPITQRIKTYIS